MKKLSRLESNKEVRRVLNRHGADLSMCSYSCVGLEIRLTGVLIRLDGREYNGQQIESIIQDFQRQLNGYFIQGDLDNWSFTSDHINYLGEKNTKTTDGYFETSESNDDDYEDVG